MRKPLLFLFLFSFSYALHAQLSLDNYFGDHMVLQRNQSLVFKGKAKPGEVIKGVIGNQTFETTVGSDGTWIATCDGLGVGGPYKLKVSGQTETIEVQDILIGDVWLCTGQSNMEWVLKNTDNSKEAIEVANFPQIRHLKVNHDLSFQPKKDITKTKWEVASPSTAGEFTAVGYYFAKYLNAELNIPIGLVNSSWGGSHVETWISKQAIKDSEVLGYYASSIPESWSQDSVLQERAILKKIYGSSDFDLTKVKEQDYFKSDYNFSDWLNINVPGQWDWMGFPGYRGNAFLQKEVTLPADFSANETVFNFGSNTGDFELYVNGELIARGYYPDGIKIDIPSNTWREGKNSIILGISQQANDGVMGFWGGKSDFYLQSGESKVALAAEPWKMIPRWNKNRHYAQWMNNSGSISYNAMIAPLVDYPIAGAIWYQGESNAGRAYQYRKSFPLLIESWRKDWGYDFPFLFVQLSSFGPTPSSNKGSNWAELREAQTMTLNLPNTGMAVTIDIGNPNDIHPRNKLDVGERLAKSALKVAYDKNIVGNGPMYKSMSTKKGRAILSFTDIGSGLMVKDKYGYLQGFEIAGADQKFYYAQAKIVGDQVEVSHPSVSSPKAVRYGWTNSPIDANLFNKEGFPASPFRTDSWKGVTEGVRYE